MPATFAAIASVTEVGIRSNDASAMPPFGRSGAENSDWKCVVPAVFMAASSAAVNSFVSANPRSTCAPRNKIVRASSWPVVAVMRLCICGLNLYGLGE